MKKKIIRAISFTLALLLLGTSQSISVLASETNNSQDGKYVIGYGEASYTIPTYDTNQEITQDYYNEEEYVTSSWNAVTYKSDVTYESDFDTVVYDIREALVNREDCQIYYTMDTNKNPMDTGQEFFINAIAETSEPNEGDYIRFNMGGYTLTASYSSINSVYYIIYTYDFNYFTTYEQEQEFDSALYQVLSSFNFGSNTTRYEKVKTIYDYICDNVVYDNTNLNDDSYDLKYTSYAALINKTSVCQGYALLLYRMLRESGINTRVVAGGNHAWNIIQIGQYYYYGDTTWDAVRTSYYYFLRGNNNFVGHTLEDTYKTTEFTSKYVISDYDYDETSDSGTSSAIGNVLLSNSYYLYTGLAIYPTITVTDIYGQLLTEGEDYVVTYSNNINAGTGTITVVGIGDPTSQITKTFYIVSGYTKVTSADNTATGISVKWDKASDVDGYYIYRRTATGSWTKINTIKDINTLNYTDTTATQGVLYYYTVRSYLGNTVATYDQTGKSIIRLAQPSIKSILSTSNGITLSWAGVTGAQGYNIYRKVTNGNWSLLGTVTNGSTLSYTDSSTSTGSNYIYTVQAYSGTYKSSYSNSGFSIELLPEPTVKSASNVSNGIKISWNCVAQADSYNIYRSSANESWNVIATISDCNINVYVDQTAVSGTTYQYTVQAVSDTYVASIDSNGKTITRVGQPTVSGVVNVATGTKVTWTKVTGAQGYYIYRKYNNIWVKVGTVTNGSTLNYTDTTASSGVKYVYSVCAYIGNNAGTYNTTGKTIISLDQPEIVSSANTSTGIKVGWSVSPESDGYYLYRKVSGSSTWTRIANISDSKILFYLDTTAVAGTSYIYTVKSYCGSYVSSFNSGKSIKRLTQPNISAALNAASGTTVKWSKTTGASGYYVYRKAAGTSSWSRIATINSGSTLTYTDKTTKAGTTYTYTVKAYSGSYVSSYNNTGKTLKRLTQPGLSSVSNTSSGVKVNWSKVTGASGYYVYRKVSGGSWSKIATIKSGSTITYTDKTAKAGTTYIYTVKAYSGSYVSSYNNTGKTLKRLTQPGLSSVSNTSSGVKVNWSKVTGASGYYVYRKVSGGSWSKIATVKSGSTITYTDKTAKAGTTYIYTVKAYSGSYVSSYNTSGKTVKRLTQPAYTLKNVSNGIKVTWSKITGASGYYVYRKTSGTSWVKIGTVKSGSTVTFTDKTAKKGKTYIYTVKAYSGSYVSSYNSGKSIKKS